MNEKRKLVVKLRARKEILASDFVYIRKRI